MKFYEAFAGLFEGFYSKMYRQAWHMMGLHLEIQHPDENSKMTQPYLFITAPGDGEHKQKLPWQPSQADLFAEDWRGDV